MKNSLVRRLIPVFFLTLIAIFIALPPKIPIKFSIGPLNVDQTFERRKIFGRNFDLVLGLDLVGGSHLVFEADTTSLSPDKRDTALQSLRNTIERRVNLFGISEPNIQLSHFEGRDRVIVELPGLKDTAAAIELVGKTAQLLFVEFGGTEEAPEVKPTDLTGADLKLADVNFDQVSGKPTVLLQFTEEGAEKFEQITERNIGKPLGMVLDGEFIDRPPLVQEKIAGGSAVIQGQFSLEQAKHLAIQLNAGALPVSIQLVEQRTIGATLGAESIQKSIQAGIIGIALVLAFMVIMYGKLGVVANIGLIIFGLLTLATYKIIPVVLTLPGIAGFLLSVGMAVDSNILIFERFREERKIRGNLRDALESSFGRAWDSIRDANIATLITAFILANPLDWQFLHTSGPVRGFAMTLALGIGVSMFTGIYVSRNLLRLFIRGSEGKKQ